MRWPISFHFDVSTYLINKIFRQRWWWLFVAVAAAVVCLWGWQRSHLLAGVAGRSPPSSSQPMMALGGPLNRASEDATLIPRGAVGDTRPADITPDDWDALNKALASDPHPAQERQRLVAFMRFQRAVTQWSEMKDGPNVAARQALARELVDQLPLHVGNGETNSGEAFMMLRAVAGDLEPDPAKQQAWMDAQISKLSHASTDVQAKAIAAEKRQNAEFASLQAELVAKWQGLPVARRDPADLAAQLQALREKVYGVGQ